ncbi:hypothetical protein LV165_006976 [Aspergillus fumigatus]|nr:hypothetical protein LV165_006976 [Aspergillus fumigatus]
MINSNHVSIAELEADTLYYYLPQHSNATSPYTFKTSRQAGDQTPHTVATLKEEIQGFLPNITIADGAKVYESLLNQNYVELAVITAQEPYMFGPGNHESNCDNDGTTDRVHNITYNVGICMPGQTNFTGFRNHFRMPSAQSGGVENFCTTASKIYAKIVNIKKGKADIMQSREPSHAGSWYSDNRSTLTRQLDQWLAHVPNEIEGIGSLPVPGSRVIIAPHAGYAYSGPCAAYAYRALDLSKAKRIFILGPSHHHYLSTLALPQLTSYYTPLSDEPLPLDTELIAKLLSAKAVKPNGSTVSFTTMTRSVDEDEHSIELHLPYIHRLLQLQHPTKRTSQYPPLVPILVGSTSASTEQAFGALLASYLEDPSNVFVISSDFCHWGLRFSYTYYVPQAPKPGPKLPLSADALPQPSNDLDEFEERIELVSAGHSLQRRDRINSREPAIHESISAFDIATMAAIATGETENFLDVIQRTGNTVCGRHPIGVIMAAIEATRTQEDGKKGAFHFIRYERSSDAVNVTDSSVSYVSAFAVL